MPLRDHFRPPLRKQRHWGGFHAQWPAVMVTGLMRKLPARYFAEPRVHVGGGAEVDVGTLDEAPASSGHGNGEEGGVATAVWAPPRPTLSVFTDLPSEAAYEVRVFDEEQNSQLVAAVEIVSPANKDRPEHRRAFVAKCAALLQQRVSVTIVDLVTTRQFNLYADLLELIGQTDPSLAPEPPATYATALRATTKDDAWMLEAWAHTLAVGGALPTLPLWLADSFAMPLELEESYEETCRILRLA